MKKNIKIFSRKIFKLLIKGVIWINTDFRINHLGTILLFYYLYFSKDSFYKSYLENGNISLSVINFTYYSLYYFSIFMIFYSGYLIYYKNYIKNKEKKLKKDGYIKFLENEYKITYEPLLKGLGFFITLLFSGIAIYMSLIGIQSSIDIANITLKGEINLENTFNMFGQLGKGLGTTILIFMIIFIYYRFNIITKNNYIKEKYYNLFYK